MNSNPPILGKQCRVHIDTPGTPLADHRLHPQFLFYEFVSLCSRSFMVMAAVILTRPQQYKRGFTTRKNQTAPSISEESCEKPNTE